MTEIRRDTIPLHDDAAIRALAERFGLEPLDKEPAWASDRPVWERYFYSLVRREAWSNGEECWMLAEGGVLKRVVIFGLKDEKEARALRLECIYHRKGGETLDEIVARFVSDPDREERERHETFVGALRNLRRHFEWQGEEIVERLPGNAISGGPLFQISKVGLKDEDVEVLRQVFKRLRVKSAKRDASVALAGEVCPTCGQKKHIRDVVKDLRAARKKVGKLAGEYADEGFDAWASQCLKTKTDQWSRARDPLYAHYRAWMQAGGHGSNMTEKAEANAAVLSEVRWGRAMRRRFPDAYDRDKAGMLYRVEIKRGA